MSPDEDDDASVSFDDSSDEEVAAGPSKASAPSPYRPGAQSAMSNDDDEDEDEDEGEDDEDDIDDIDDEGDDAEEPGAGARGAAGASGRGWMESSSSSSDDDEGDDDDDDVEDDDDDDDEEEDGEEDEEDDGVHRAIEKSRELLTRGLAGNDEDDPGANGEFGQELLEGLAPAGAGAFKRNVGMVATVRDVHEGKGRRVKKRRKIGRSKYHTNTHVPEEVLIQQGQANLCYANGDYEKAHGLLVEVVRRAPNLHDAYDLLGLVHEGLGNKRKAVNFFMIAAHLSPKDSSLWERVAQTCEELHLNQQANYCLSKAIRASQWPDNWELYWSRAYLRNRLGQADKAIKDALKLHKHMPHNADFKILLATLYCELGKYHKVVNVLKQEEGAQAQRLEPRAVNVFAESYIKQGYFLEAVPLIENCLKDWDGSSDDEHIFLDLKAKLGVSALYLKDDAKAEECLSLLYAKGGNANAKALLVVADTYFGLDKPILAQRYYTKLMVIKQFDRVALNIKIAQCQQLSGKLPDAVASYRDALAETSRQSITYLEASVPLIELLNTLAKDDEARSALDDIQHVNHPTIESMNAALQSYFFNVYLREAQLNFGYGRKRRYAEIMFPALLYGWEVHHYLSTSRRKGLMRSQGNSKFHETRMPSNEDKGIFSLRDKASERGGGARGRSVHRQRRNFPDSTLLSEDKLLMFTIECCKILIELEDTEKGKDILECALSCVRLKHTKPARNTLCFLTAVVEFMDGNFDKAYQHLKESVKEFRKSNATWNLLFKAAHRADQIAPLGRFLARLKQTHANDLRVLLALGHYHYIVGNQNSALNEYLQVHQRCPNNAVLTLFIALAYLHYAAAIKCREERRNVYTMKAFQYLGALTSLKEGSPVPVYNTARALHQLGHVSLAERHYRRVLEMIGGGATEGGKALERSAAHNLATIYMLSGAPELACEVRMRHLCI